MAPSPIPLGFRQPPCAKFRFEADTANHLRVRFTDLSYFRPETMSLEVWRWQVVERKRTLWHTLPQNGSYKVYLTVCNENS